MAILELTMLEFIFWALLQAIIVAVVVGKILGKGEMAGPLLLWKSKKGFNFLNKIAEKKNFWEKYGDFGIILAFGLLGGLFVFRRKKNWKRAVMSVVAPLLIFGPFIVPRLILGGPLQGIDFSLIFLFLGGFSSFIFFSIGSSAYQVILRYLGEQEVMAMAGPAIPGINIEGSPFQGIPWYGWLAFPILIFVHELSHGVLLRAAKLKVKNTGVAFFGLLPAGAFVEPDEEELASADVDERNRVYSVGSASNCVTACVFLAISLVFFSPLLGSLGVSDYTELEVAKVLPESNAKNLEQGMKVMSINGQEVTSVAEIQSVLEDFEPGDKVDLTTSQGEMSVRLNEEGMIGAYFKQGFSSSMPAYLNFLVNLNSFVYLVFFFNLVIGIMNLLPLKPLDGGLLTESVLKEKIGKELASKTATGITVVSLVLLLVNMLPLFFS